MNNFFKNLPLVILLGSIMLFPSFVVGEMSSGKTIELRVEDFLILFFISLQLLFFLFKGKKSVQRPPFFILIASWIGFALFGFLINLVLGNLGFIDRAIFYFLKEVELLSLYLLFFYNIKDFKSAKVVIGFSFFFASLNVIYIFYQIIVKKFNGEYGAAALCEYGVFPTGGFFLLLFLFFLSFFVFYYNNLQKSIIKKIFVGSVAMFPIMGVFGSESKTVFLALIFSMVLFLSLYAYKTKKIGIMKIFLTSAIVISFSLVSFIFSMAYINHATRIETVFVPGNIVTNYASGRGTVIKYLFDNVSSKFNQQPLLTFVGLGIGYVTEAHNQFLRNYAEIGIIGSLIFLALIIYIFKKGLDAYLNGNNLVSEAGASIILMTSAMMIFSLATDPFFSVKTSEIYWIFMAINATILSSKVNNNITLAQSKINNEYY
jgi:hypothetical protein